MICPECRYDYSTKEAINKSVCPACKINFIDGIIDLTNPNNALNKLRDGICYLGKESLKDKELLILLISSLYKDEKELQKLLIISINESVSRKMYELLEVYDRDIKLESIESELVSDAFLSHSAAKKIIDYWCYVLDFDENKETIRLIEDNNYVNSKGEIIYNGGRSKLIFSEGLAYVHNDWKNKRYINYRGENILDLDAIVTPQVDKQFLLGFGYLHHVEFKEFHNGLALFETLNGPYGFIDKNGKIVIKLNCEQVLQFSEGLCAVRLNGLWGFIDKSGSIKVKHKYEKVYSFSEGLAPVNANDNWTFIDYDGKIKLSLKNYSEAEPFFNGIAKVKNDKVGFIDKEGKELIKTKYEDANHFYKENDLIAVKYEKWGVINKNDEVVIPFEFDVIGLINKNLFWVCKKNNVFRNGTIDIYGLYSSDGVKLLDVNYGKLKLLDFDILLISELSIRNKVNRYDLIEQEYSTSFKLYNIKQNIIYDLSKNYYSIEPFVNGLAKAINPRSLFEWVNYIDKMGNIKIPNLENNYDSDFYGNLIGGESFYDGYATVSSKIQHYKSSSFEVTTPDGDTYVSESGGGEYRLWGIINLKGELVCSFKFKNISANRNRNFWGDLDNNGRNGYLNKKGRWLYSEKNNIENTPINFFYKYDKVGVLSEGFLAVKYNKKWGYVDIDGKEHIPLKYSDASEFRDGIAKVREFSEEKHLVREWALINSRGVHITPFQYYNIIDYGEEFYKVTQYNKELGRHATGLIDKTGNIQIPVIYDEIRSENYFHGFYCVKKVGKWGFIDDKGKVVIDFLYNEIGYESNGLVLFYKRDYFSNSVEESGFGLIDRNGKELANSFSGLGFMKIKDDDAYKIYDLNSISDYKNYIGRWNSDKERYDLDDFWKCNFFNGLTIYYSDNKYGFINEHGNILKKKYNNNFNSLKSCEEPILYDDIYKPKNGLYKVKLDGKFGCVNLDGLEIIECKYYGLWILPEGLVNACIITYDENKRSTKLKYGHLNLKGEVISPFV